MIKHKKIAANKVGLPPGTLLHSENDQSLMAHINVQDFDEQNYFEGEIQTIDELVCFRDKPTVTWIQVIGGNNVPILEKVGKCFCIHDLVLEDIHNTGHRPKMEDYGEYLFLIMKTLREMQGETVIEQVSLIIGKNYVISFQESEIDIFEPVRQRIRSGKGKIRKAGPDYLAYALLDAVVDNYFVVLERLGEQVESLEDEVMLNPSPAVIKQIQSLKIDLLFVRKSVWPLREIISFLERGESELFQNSTLIYIKDVYDHTIQVIDTVETYRDMVSGLLDIYLSSVSNRMNEVMKVLTIIATIFIPLTFLAGLEGMNFKYMPELEWEWGYPALLLIMVIIVLVMIRYFKRKKWI